MNIEVIFNGGPKTWNLLIDGKCPLNSFQRGKDYIKHYLKKNYGIDLLTDKNIKRNYIEYQTKKVAAKNGKIYFVKEKRQLI
ncbi:MAG: hypothetical protein V4547_17620 [Bacteroidota bacterium]